MRVADRVTSKDDTAFREKFKNGKDFPAFNGEVYEWTKWKTKFKGFLGQNHLESLLVPPVEDEDDDNYDPEDNEKNAWLYHTFKSKLHAKALTYLSGMEKDSQGLVIPDGREAWKRIKAWYEGSGVRRQMAQYARAKINTLELHQNGSAATYLTTMGEMFEILDEANEPLFDGGKITALLDGIKDKKYDVTKKIILNDESMKYEQALAKLRKEELSIAMKIDQSGNNASAQGTSGRRGSGKQHGGRKKKGRRNRQNNNSGGNNNNQNQNQNRNRHRQGTPIEDQTPAIIVAKRDIGPESVHETNRLKDEAIVAVVQISRMRPTMMVTNHPSLGMIETMQVSRHPEGRHEEECTLPALPSQHSRGLSWRQMDRVLQKRRAMRSKRHSARFSQMVEPIPLSLVQIG